MKKFFDIEINRTAKSAHFWAGPLGMHIFWPDVWRSKPDWCSNWNKKNLY